MPLINIIDTALDKGNAARHGPCLRNQGTHSRPSTIGPYDQVESFARSTLKYKLKSSLFDLARKGTSFWLTNHDNTSAPIKRARRPINRASFGAPTMINIPLGISTRLHADNE
jgi:hypothetical protein